MKRRRLTMIPARSDADVGENSDADTKIDDVDDDADEDLRHEEKDDLPIPTIRQSRCRAFCTTGEIYWPHVAWLLTSKAFKLVYLIVSEMFEWKKTFLKESWAWLLLPTIMYLAMASYSLWQAPYERYARVNMACACMFASKFVMEYYSGAIGLFYGPGDQITPLTPAECKQIVENANQCGNTIGRLTLAFLVALKQQASQKELVEACITPLLPYMKPSVRRLLTANKVKMCSDESVLIHLDWIKVKANEANEENEAAAAIVANFIDEMVSVYKSV